MRVMGGLDMCISLLDDQAALDAQTAHLKAQHIERKIPGNYFTVSTVNSKLNEIQVNEI